MNTELPGQKYILEKVYVHEYTNMLLRMFYTHSLARKTVTDQPVSVFWNKLSWILFSDLEQEGEIVSKSSQEYVQIQTHDT